MSKSVLSDLATFRTGIPVRLNPHPLFDNFGEIIERNTALNRLKLDPSFTYLLFFGFIRAYKGLDLLIEGFSDKRLRNRNLKLIVAGEFYEDAKPYKDKVNELNLDKEIIFFDRFIIDDEVKYFFSPVDLVIQPYRSATQSGVTQIAYHFGKPMLVTDVGGLSEIVPDGKCGYVVKPDPMAIADAILDYYTKNRKECFVAGVLEEKAKFTWDKLTAAIMQIYNEITN
jgi:D-inositol-3-phosphate glycosyltransferase